MFIFQYFHWASVSSILSRVFVTLVNPFVTVKLNLFHCFSEIFYEKQDKIYQKTKAKFRWNFVCNFNFFRLLLIEDLLLDHGYQNKTSEVQWEWKSFFLFLSHISGYLTIHLWYLKYGLKCCLHFVCIFL